MTLLWPVKAHSHTIALNHTITENGGCIAKMISEKAACVFQALCALAVTSLWLGQIVLLWVASAKCCLPVAQQRVADNFGALLRICVARCQRDIYWQGHVCITAAHKAGSMIEDAWTFRHDLDVWIFQLLSFITSEIFLYPLWHAFNYIPLCHHSIFPAVPLLGQHHWSVTADSTHTRSSACAQSLVWAGHIKGIDFGKYAYSLTC